MNRKYVPSTICILIAIMLVTGCGPPASTLDSSDTDSPTVAPTATAAVHTATSSPTSLPDTATPIPNTATPVATTTPIPSATPVPTPTEPAIETYIAHLQGEKLLVVTHVVGGRAMDTQQYMELPFRQGIYKMGWSPSGRYLAFSMVADDLFSHVFILDVGEGGTPVDLGIANDWAWSPDSSLLAFEHEYELWLYSPADGQSRRLTTHLGGDWLWGSPVFTPDGNALVAPGTLSDDMDRRGNTRYKLFRVPLDGSAAGSYPPAGSTAITEEISGRLPLVLRFSPDGQKLAVITSSYVDGCATLGNYFVGNADGSDLRELPVASLSALGGPEQKMYFYGDSLAWTPESDGLWVNGLVKDCGKTFDVVGQPQISRVTLDGREHEIIPGAYGHLSLDRTGALLGVVTQRGVHHVQILGRDGHLVLDLGEGYTPVLQP